MKLEVWAITKTSETYLQEGISLYQKKINPYYKEFMYRELDNTKLKKAQNPQAQKEVERDEVFKLLKPADVLILADDKGKAYTSEEFAQFLQKNFNSASGSIIILIGGAFGFHPDVYERANTKISLSALTFTHQMVRLILLEQIYRAFTILRGEPYHHS